MDNNKLKEIIDQMKMVEVSTKQTLKNYFERKSVNEIKEQYRIESTKDLQYYLINLDGNGIENATQAIFELLNERK